MEKIKIRKCRRNKILDRTYVCVTLYLLETQRREVWQEEKEEKITRK